VDTQSDRNTKEKITAGKCKKKSARITARGLIKSRLITLEMTTEK
jgi:hypothetical protein